MLWLSITVAILTLGFTVGGLLVRRFRKTGLTLLILTAVLTAVIAGGAAICWDAPKNEPLEPDYGLLLGCGLENGQATREMVRRCYMGLAWMEEHPTKYLIVSGGDPGNHGVTEAAVMAAWLRNHGAKADRILLEDRANDTRENLLYSEALAREQGLEADTVEIITSEYHQTRARFLAERSGQEALSLSARTPVLKHLVSSVREVYCMVSEFLGL